MLHKTETAALRIYIGESHYGRGMPVYEDILYRARQRGMAGATVFKTDVGFGHTEPKAGSSHFSGRVSDDVPVIIEIIDGVHKLESFAQEARQLLGWRGLMALFPVRVLHYGEDTADGDAARNLPPNP
ncbi:MAG TPA: DUF190 domain-containing protein [Alphaproteobacteria bacterium]|nr:DUF190 domain-containing protein [Alphaproteobacteria bacterium]